MLSVRSATRRAIPKAGDSCSWPGSTVLDRRRRCRWCRRRLVPERVARSDRAKRNVSRAGRSHAGAAADPIEPHEASARRMAAPEKRAPPATNAAAHRRLVRTGVARADAGGALHRWGGHGCAPGDHRDSIHGDPTAGGGLGQRRGASARHARVAAAAADARLAAVDPQGRHGPAPVHGAGSRNPGRARGHPSVVRPPCLQRPEGHGGDRSCRHLAGRCRWLRGVCGHSWSRSQWRSACWR